MLKDELRPTRKVHVFDLAEESGFDTTDWIHSSNDPRGFKANPKYCYEWSFVEPGKVAILNLWYENMLEENGLIVQHNNFRENARENAGKPTWVKRAMKLDEALQRALHQNLAIRVIVIDGKMRNKVDASSPPSRVMARELDAQPWTIAKYDWATGANTLVRGVLNREFVDQFEIDQSDKLKLGRRSSSGLVFVRDPAVRRGALERANGRCELCGKDGFKMQTGAVYLETHHIIPLFEGGPDELANVAALCPNDHRKAHYGLNRDKIRDYLIKIVNN
jgi:hypothetical protein|tara:strand:- start:7824 stop:8654 length:831 start_codon:yes stop_codon:yes gene_type:complete